MKKIRLLTMCLLLLCASAYAKPKRVPAFRVFAPTRESQLAQNAMIERLGLLRFKNEKQLHAAVQSGELVSIDASKFVSVDKRLPHNRRYVRPWVNELLAEIGAAYFIEFGRPLIVTSAVRTEQVQRSLRRWNRNAAPVHGEVASSHLAGTTIDISKRAMSVHERLFIQDILFDYALRERVIVIEENAQRCFHIFIMPEEVYGESERAGLAHD